MMIEVSDCVFDACACLWLSLAIVLAGAGVLNMGLELSAFEVDGIDGLGRIGVDDEVRAAWSAFKLFLFC